MFFVQISDMHLIQPGHRTFGGVDPAAYAESCVKAVNLLKPQPELVLVTGDIADIGTAEVYDYACEILDRLHSPYFVVPGNHDNRVALYDAFKGRACPVAPADGNTEAGDGGPAWLPYSFSHGRFRFIALDTLSEGSPAGYLCAEQLYWLESLLKGSATNSRVIFFHHPPVATGHPLIDESRLRNAADLQEILAHYPAETHLLCGHVHRPVSTIWNGAAVHICPSVIHQLSFNLRAESEFSFIYEPPAFRVFIETGDTLISHLVYINDFGPHYPVGSL